MKRICLWPDGTWCWYEEREEYLTWKSDDFEVIEFLNDVEYEDVEGWISLREGISYK